eukprot:5962332-Prymnesium_polylepis.1
MEPDARWMTRASMPASQRARISFSSSLGSLTTSAGNSLARATCSRTPPRSLRASIPSQIACDGGGRGNGGGGGKKGGRGGEGSGGDGCGGGGEGSGGGGIGDGGGRIGDGGGGDGGGGDGGGGDRGNGGGRG